MIAKRIVRIPFKPVPRLRITRFSKLAGPMFPARYFLLISFSWILWRFDFDMQHTAADKEPVTSDQKQAREFKLPVDGKMRLPSTITPDENTRRMGWHE